MNNTITNGDYPTVVKIHPDGRFEADMLLYYPHWQSVTINKAWIPLYLEPWQTTVMIVDWEDFKQADIYRDRSYHFKKTEYRGPFAGVNSGIASFDYNKMPYKEFKKYATELLPDEFIAEEKEREEEVLNLLELYAIKNSTDSLTKKLLMYNVKLEFAQRKFSYVDIHQYHHFIRIGQYIIVIELISLGISYKRCINPVQ